MWEVFKTICRTQNPPTLCSSRMSASMNPVRLSWEGCRQCILRLVLLVSALLAYQCCEICVGERDLRGGGRRGQKQNRLNMSVKNVSHKCLSQ